MAELHIVIGAGPLGSSVARELVGLGKPVRIINRSGSGKVPGAESVAADIADEMSLRGAVSGATVLYQCAQPPYDRWVTEFSALQNRVLEAAVRVGADLVIADNLYAYGPPSGSTISEYSHEAPTTRKGRVRKSMADAALAAHRAGRLRVALSRPSTYFGPGYDQSGKAVFARAAHGKAMQFIGSPDAPHTFTFVPDAGTGMAIMGTSDTAWGRVWIPPVQPAITQREFGELIWSAAGQHGPARARFARAPMIRMLGLASPRIREVGEMMYEFEDPYVVDSSAFESAFGVAPTAPADAVASTIEWYGR